MNDSRRVGWVGALVLGLIVVVAAGAVLLLRSPEPESAAQVEPTGQAVAAIAPEQPIPVRAGTSSDPAPDASALRRRESQAVARRQSGVEARRRAIERIESLGHNTHEAKRIRDAWEVAQDRVAAERSRIEAEMGPLAFDAMRASDRAIMNDLYYEIGPDAYEGALYGAEKAIRVELGIVDLGTPAAELGLQRGDQIAWWGNENNPVFSLSDIREFRKSLSNPLDPVILGVCSDGGQCFEVETKGGKLGSPLIGFTD